jgi:hypothetical protein
MEAVDKRSERIMHEGAVSELEEADSWVPGMSLRLVVHRNRRTL